MAVFIDQVEAASEIVTPIAASAWPSGRVHDDAYRYITDAICAVFSLAAQIERASPWRQFVAGEDNHLKLVTVWPHAVANGKPIYPRP